MKKILIPLLFIVLIFNAGCDSLTKQPFTPKDYLGTVWVSDDNIIQFTFDESKDSDGYGNITSAEDNMPILVFFSRANFLSIVVEEKYNENKNIRESVILDGTVKLKEDKLILTVLHNKIFDKEYKTITFIQQK